MKLLGGILLTGMLLGGCTIPSAKTTMKVTTPMGWGIDYESGKDQEWNVDIDEIDPDTGKVVKTWRVKVGAKTSESMLQAYMSSQALMWNAVAPIIQRAAAAAPAQ